MRRFSALLSAVPMVLLVCASSAQADDGALEVPIHREAPFDRWCVKPVCASRADARAPLFKKPAVIATTSNDGLLEARLKRSLSDALEAAAKATLGPAYNEAVADVAGAMAATALGDQTRLEDLGGLGASVMRASIAYHLDAAIAADPACTGPRRIDAIYEGMAMSVALAPLEFPQRRGHVPAACAATAKRTATEIDSAALGVVLSEQARRDAQALADAIDAAKKRCAAVPGASEATLARVRNAQSTWESANLLATAASLRALRAAGPSPIATPAPAPPATTPALEGAPPSEPAPPPQPTPPSEAEVACGKAIDALAAVDPARLDPLMREGLREASIDAIVAPIHAAGEKRLGLIARIASGANDLDDVRALVEQMTRTLAQSAGLPVDAPVLKDAIAALPKAVVVKDGGVTVDPNAIVSFLVSEYDVADDGKPGLRSLLGLKPTPWVFEVNGGVPQLDLSKQLVVGDATIGYATSKFGLVGRGWIDNFSINDTGTHNDYLRTGGSLEGFWLSGGAADKLRVELRFAGSFDYYDTTTYPLVNALSNYYDFDARIGRGSLLAGLRYGAPNDRFSMRFLVGGGGQYEDPDTQTFNGATKSKGVLNSQSGFSAQASARLLLRVRVVPQIVGVRVRSESQYFDITREQLAIPDGAGQSATNITSSVERQQQIEVHNRLFIDADVASFGGFVPAVFGGLDYIGIQGSATSSSTAIPSLGAGIFRNTY